MTKWRRGRAAPLYDTSGLGDLLVRAQDTLGGDPLLGTRLLFGPREMLRAAREIEAGCKRHPGVLLVGFQLAACLQQQRGRYEDLASSGVTVLAFGAGVPDPPVDGVNWLELPDDPAALENQWFLVTRSPEPIALAGFECAPEGHAVPTSARPAPDRAYAGFVSDDERLVDALILHLDGVAAGRGAYRTERAR